MSRSAEQAQASQFPLRLIAWAALGIALHVGVARFTCGVMLPALQRDLALDGLPGGAPNTVHLLGCLAGTLAAPALVRLGESRQIQPVTTSNQNSSTELNDPLAR